MSQTVNNVIWYKVVKLGEDYTTQAFLVDSPFSQKYGGSATYANGPSSIYTPGTNGNPGKASSPYPKNNAPCVGGQPVSPLAYYVYPKGTTFGANNALTDAWSPTCPCPGAPAGQGCPSKGTRMPLWIPVDSEKCTDKYCNPSSSTSIVSSTNLNSTSVAVPFRTVCAAPTTLAAPTSLLFPSCAYSANNVGTCTVDCQYPYGNGDGGSQHRGVALSP